VGPLRHLYPDAAIPVVQVSLPSVLPPAKLFELGQSLGPLRSAAVLVVASGGVVHNLRHLDFSDREAPVYSWAREFDQWFKAALDRRDVQAILSVVARREGETNPAATREAAPHTYRAVPSPEHFLPVLVALGAGNGGHTVEQWYEGFEYGSISMRCFALS
jgi:4,5-DOPA dioxygenase extradiol